MLVNEVLIIAYFWDACTTATCSQYRMILVWIIDLTGSLHIAGTTHLRAALITFAVITIEFETRAVRYHSLSTMRSLKLPNTVIVGSTFNKRLERSLLAAVPCS